MGTRFVRTTRGYAAASTTRYLLIQTTNTTRIFMSTGYTAIRLYNSGTNTLIWGGEAISSNSGNFIFPAMSKEWENVGDNFNFYMIADSANSFVSITEYLHG